MKDARVTVILTGLLTVIFMSSIVRKAHSLFNVFILDDNMDVASGNSVVITQRV